MYQTSFINPATGKRRDSFRGTLDDARASLAITFRHFINLGHSNVTAWADGLVLLCRYDGKGGFVFTGPDGFTYFIEEVA